MSELIAKLNQLTALRQLKDNPGWELLAEQWQVRLVMDQVALTAPPDKVNAEMRGYLAGKVQGASDAANLIEVLISGLQSELEHIREQEKQDARSDPGNSRDTSDDALAGASSDNPLSGKPDAS